MSALLVHTDADLGTSAGADSEARARAESGAGGDDRRGDGDGDGATLSVGTAIGLGAVVMTFGALFLAYAVVRVQASSWPPPGESRAPPVWPWPLGATAMALLGSAALARAGRRPDSPAGDERAGGQIAGPVRGQATGAAPAARALSSLLVAFCAGLGFLGIQLTAWIWLARGGFRPDGGLVASVVYALTVFHAVHAAAAVVALSPFVYRAWRARTIRPSALRAVSSFWHLVTLIWAIVFVAVFVV